MNSDMKQCTITISSYLDTFFVHSTEEIYELIADQLIALQTMLSSPFISNFLDRANQVLLTDVPF